jgi:hypothetical protein
VKVLLGAVLIDALHSALEDREKAFDRVCASPTATVLLAAMRDRQMLRELLANCVDFCGYWQR